MLLCKLVLFLRVFFLKQYCYVVSLGNPQTDKWEFLETPHVISDPEQREAHFAWSEPVPKSAIQTRKQRDESHYFVYVLLTREMTYKKKKKAWQQSLQVGSMFWLLLGCCFYVLMWLVVDLDLIGRRFDSAVITPVLLMCTT